MYYKTYLKDKVRYFVDFVKVFEIINLSLEDIIYASELSNLKVFDDKEYKNLEDVIVLE